MASFLSDPLTQSQASTVETFMRLGLAAEQSRESAAAAQAAHEKDILVTQEAEEKRQLAVRAQINEERGYEARLRAETIAGQTADKFTEQSIYGARNYIGRRESTAERLYGSALNDTKYSKQTHDQIVNYLSGLSNAGSSVMAQVGALKPGQAPDLADYEQTVSKLPLPSFTLDPTYEAVEKNKAVLEAAQAHKALAGKSGRGGGGGGVSKDAKKYSDNLIKYNYIQGDIENRKSNPSLPDLTIQAKGGDPYAHDKTLLFSTKIALKQNADHLYEKFKSNPSSVVADPKMRAIIAHYASEGNPFDPDEQQNALGEISKEYDNQNDPATKNLLQSTYQYLSGRSIKSNYVQTSNVPVSQPQSNSALAPMPLIPSTFAPMR